MITLRPKNLFVFNLSRNTCNGEKSCARALQEYPLSGICSVLYVLQVAATRSSVGTVS